VNSVLANSIFYPCWLPAACSNISCIIVDFFIQRFQAS
jgi:hypothetical protein